MRKKKGSNWCSPHPGQPRPAGEVNAFFTSMRLTTNVTDEHLPYNVEEDGRGSYAVEIVESIMQFINKDNLEALV